MILSHLRYLRYMLLHKWYVFLECWKLGIAFQGAVHDLSKFFPDEWIPYADYYYGDFPRREEVPGGLQGWVVSRFKETVEQEYTAAWNLHLNRNPHHWQFWVLIRDNGEIIALPMPDHYRREMLADWRGAGRVQGNPDTRGWYEERREQLLLHPDTRRWIEVQLGIIEEDDGNGFYQSYGHFGG